MQQTLGYTRTAVVFHWFMALLITAGFTLGATMTDLHMSPRKIKLYATKTSAQSQQFRADTDALSG